MAAPHLGQARKALSSRFFKASRACRSAIRPARTSEGSRRSPAIGSMRTITIAGHGGPESAVGTLPPEAARTVSTRLIDTRSRQDFPRHNAALRLRSR